jgi:hypothetical protein
MLPLPRSSTARALCSYIGSHLPPFDMLARHTHTQFWIIINELCEKKSLKSGGNTLCRQFNGKSSETGAYIFTLLCLIFTLLCLIFTLLCLIFAFIVVCMKMKYWYIMVKNERPRFFNIWQSSLINVNSNAQINFNFCWGNNMHLYKEACRVLVWCQLDFFPARVAQLQTCTFNKLWVNASWFVKDFKIANWNWMLVFCYNSFEVDIGSRRLTFSCYIAKSQSDFLPQQNLSQ